MTASDEQVLLLKRRLERERQARKQAESLLSEKSDALYSALQSSQQAQKKLELALWASQESFWEWRAHNDAFVIRSFSLTRQNETLWQGTPTDLLHQVHEDDLHNLQFHWSMAVQNGRERLEFTFRFKLGGSFQWVRLRGRVLERNDQGVAMHIVGITRNISEERRAEQSFQLMASAFSSSREPMAVLSRHFAVTEYNQAFASLLGLAEKQDVTGRSLKTMLKDNHAQLEKLDEGGQVRFETTLLIRDADPVPVDVSVSSFNDEHQRDPYLIATLQDISERKANEARLRKMALHDELTGLLNRNGLNDTVATLIDQQHPFALLFLDLDGFKQMNDSAGHEFGDRCLQTVASLLTSRFGDSGQVARWGGDEFIVVVPELTYDDVVVQSEALIVDIERQRVVTTQCELTLSASIGVASFPEHGQQAAKIIQCADAAMYKAKTDGKGRVQYYQDGLYEHITKQVSLANDLRRAVEHQLLDFYLQGKYDTYGRLRGAEVLCRWVSGFHGAVSPAEFIPLAEKSRLDIAIGLQALEAACDVLRMMDAQDTAIPLAINVSVNQLLDPSFATAAREICARNQVSPALIEMELTESIFVRDEEAAESALQALRNEGFTLALDDFGTGFSSLSYLRRFQFEVVKLDRSLVVDIDTSSKAQALFQGVLSMLNSLKIETVVEGVEKETYLPFIRDAGATLVQGFHFDKPMPHDQFVARHARSVK